MLSSVFQVIQFHHAMGAMLVPIAIGLVLSFCTEQFHSPRPYPVWQRHLADLLLHTGLWLILFLIEFLQFRRPWLALCLSSTIYYVLVLINHAKFRSLREPFIYQDFEYFLDAIKHPRLYLPFFGFWKIALCLAAVAAALWIGVSVEQPLTATNPTEQVWIACITILFIAVALLFIGNLRKAELSFKPSQDFKKHGLLAMLWLYARAERQSLPVTIGKSSTLAHLPADPSPLPDTIVVQSESFFDLRRAFSNIDPTVLTAFDQACQNSIRFGTLTVPAWGANTVRTEFEFLTGINTAELGIDQFNPYRRCVQNGLPSIAHEFKKRGYRTVCVHPYPASFYQRDKIFPLLGFDEFIDIKSFDAATHSTEQCPYISDAVLTNKVLALLDQPNVQPLFIFVITMENHGPLHLETISESETLKWVKQALPAVCKDLPVYLRHLDNADQMIDRLIKHFSSSQEELSGHLTQTPSSHPSSPQRPAQLLWYGDHVPVLPEVYDSLGMPDGQTDYFLWRSDNLQRHAPQPLHVHQLAVELLK